MSRQGKLLVKLLSLICASVLTISVTSNCIANPVIPVPTQPQSPQIAPSTPNIDAKSFILMDANSGKILASKNADMRLPPASLTKLMSLYIISSSLKSGSIRTTDKVRISANAWKTGGSRMFIKVNDEVPVQDLMTGIAVASGNDAAVAMAEYIGGTEDSFTNLMNAEAKALGMNNTHFMDSNGLPNPKHYSSAYDLAILAKAITTNFPEDYKLFSEKWFTFNGIRQPNRNRLLWRYPYADGLKTGHTADAGYCLVGSAVKDGTRLISVVMGAPSDEARTEDSIRLLTYGFRFFETHKLYNAGASLAHVRVWKGENKEVALGLKDDLFVTLPAGQYKNVQANIDLHSPLQAPIFKDSPYGTLNITLNKQILASKPLVALNNNLKGGVWRSIIDTINFNFHKLFSKPVEKIDNG